MLIYDKKDDKVLIYEMKGDNEKIRKYKKGVISRHKNDGLVYSLKTNCHRIKSMFDEANESSEIHLCDLDYYTARGSYFGEEYSRLQLLELEKDTIERYILGLYDDLVPINVINYLKDRKDIVHRFLKTGGLEGKQVSIRMNWEFNNLIDLPRELYLLQLLLLGKYDRVVSENIRKQLGLFDINYLKSISLLDLKDMLETGLVSGSMEDIENKASIGGRILAKRR